jgi:oligo-1,6-glucosidase
MTFQPSINNVAIKEGYSEEEALKIVNTYSRDNARTPFQWDSSENAGFTTGKPWLKVNENYKEINAKSQAGKENSVFSFYKKLVNLRKSEEFKDAVIYGKFESVLENYDNLFAFYREGSSKKLMLLANYQKEQQAIKLSKSYSKVLLNNCDEVIHEEDKIILQGYQALILEV